MSHLPFVTSLLTRRALLVIGCTTTAATATLLTYREADEPAPIACEAPLFQVLGPPSPEVEEAPESPPLAPAQKRAPTGPDEVHLVFLANHQTYVKLADLGGDSPDALSIPRHGALRLTYDEGIRTLVGEVAARDVPMKLAAWRGKRVRVDGACEARVTGIAVVARLVGDPDYADATEWNKHTVMESGHPVLAARLDGCTGRVARDAALPNIIVPTTWHDEALEAQAAQALIESDLGRGVQQAWDEETRGKAGAWSANNAITTQVLRHPGTGEVFVSAHGHVQGMCGDPRANLWGLYRVEDGALVPVQVRAVEELEQIYSLIDLEGDGELELVGHGWLDDDLVVARSDGEVVEQIEVPFYGCPC